MSQERAAAEAPPDALAPHRALLTWAPPSLRAVVTYHVGGDGPRTLVAGPGQDSRVVWDAPTHGRLRLVGGRNWVITGGEVRNDVPWPDLDDRAALQFEQVEGTAFVEGLLVDGPYGTDGIRLGPGSSGTTLVVQDSRILNRRTQGQAGYHADVIQAYGGVRALHVDRLTATTDFQGQMFKQELGTRFGPSDLRRVDYTGLAPQQAYLVNLVMSRPTGSVWLREVWTTPAAGFVHGDFCRALSPAEGSRCRVTAGGRHAVTWLGTPIRVIGEVRQGPPPGGEWVPAGVAGLGYRSPGYGATP